MMKKYVFVPANGEHVQDVQPLWSVSDDARRTVLTSRTTEAITCGIIPNDPSRNVEHDGEYVLPSSRITEELLAAGIEFKMYHVNGCSKQFLNVPSIVGKILCILLKREDLHVKAEVVLLTQAALCDICTNKVLCNPQGPAEKVCAFIEVHRYMPIKEEGRSIGAFKTTMCDLAGVASLPAGLPKKLRAAFKLDHTDVLSEATATNLGGVLAVWNDVYTLSVQTGVPGVELTTLSLLMCLALVGPAARGLYIGFLMGQYKVLKEIDPKQARKSEEAKTLGGTLGL